MPRFHAYRARMINKAYRKGGLDALRKQAHMSDLPTSVRIRRFLASPAGRRLAETVSAKPAASPVDKPTNEPHREV